MERKIHICGLFMWSISELTCAGQVARGFDRKKASVASKMLKFLKPCG